MTMETPKGFIHDGSTWLGNGAGAPGVSQFRGSSGASATASLAFSSPLRMASYIKLCQGFWLNVEW